MNAWTPAAIPILMYHSISDGPGPTSIAPDTFRRQLDLLTECGYQTASLAELAGWRRGETVLDAKTVVLTFDDGFADFADEALPALASHGFSATVFLPAAKMGGVSDWEPSAGIRPRALLDWNVARSLADQGVDFGAHSLTHADLTTLSAAAMHREIVGSQALIADKLGRAVPHFAPPFGKSNRAVRDVVAAHYTCSVGTTLAMAQPTSDRFDLPRIEMWYCRDLARWRAYLQGGARVYFGIRRTLRAIRHLARVG